MKKGNKTAMIILIAAAGLILAIPAVWGLSILSHKKIDQAVRDSAAPARFARLTDGYIQYELDGPEDGDVVVLVSGFSVPYYCWDYIYRDLVSVGYRVLRYNHYGRGYSDHVRADYGPQLFERELSGLIEVLGLNTPLTLCALSMGGAISVYYTNRHPEQVRALALVSPAGFPLQSAADSTVLNTPVLGDFIIAVFGDAILTGRNVTNLMSVKDHPEFQEQFVHYIRYRGRTAALLSTIRHMPINNMPEEYDRLSGDVPVLLLWGKEDAVIPFTNSELVRKAVPQAEFHAIPDAGHNSQYEKPELVLGYLLDFLKRDD
ncbi:MAG: alpha/beta hydrolase [Spirochaetales bacterium]|nr:alpha/beta hydrolase [Spirochaetales bacterium]